MFGVGNSQEPEEKSKRFFLSLRFITPVAAAVLVAVTATVITGINEKSMRATLTQEAKTQLVLEARNLATTSADPLLSEFPELSLVPLAKDLVNDRPEFVDVAIIDHTGTIQGSPVSRLIGTFWQRPANLTLLPPGDLLDYGEKLSQSESILLVECPIYYAKDSELGWVALTLEKAFIDKKIRQHRRAMMPIAAALLLAAVIVSVMLMSFLFRPLPTLTAGMERFGRGDLDSPILVHDATELGMLANSLNSMAGQLKTSWNLARAREKEIIDTQKEIIGTLGQVVESRSAETANHTIRVGDMSYQLALLAGLSEDEAQMIRVASPMHDVGKIGIPDSILNKPGKLTLQEYKTMQSHTEIGFSILNKSERPIFKAAAVIASQHHERWDGMGYPRKIQGDCIHIYGRIVGLVDVFDALFSNRVYRKAMPLENVLEIINDERGSHFDPDLVDLFINHLPKFLAIAERFQDSPMEEPAPVPEPEPEPQKLCP